MQQFIRWKEKNYKKICCANYLYNHILETILAFLGSFLLFRSAQVLVSAQNPLKIPFYRNCHSTAPITAIKVPKLSSKYNSYSFLFFFFKKKCTSNKLTWCNANFCWSWKVGFVMLFKCLNSVEPSENISISFTKKSYISNKKNHPSNAT